MLSTNEQNCVTKGLYAPRLYSVGNGWSSESVANGAECHRPGDGPSTAGSSAHFFQPWPTAPAIITTNTGDPGYHCLGAAHPYHLTAANESIWRPHRERPGTHSATNVQAHGYQRDIVGVLLELAVHLLHPHHQLHRTNLLYCWISPCLKFCLPAC
jgi:hypothetical protein